MLYYITDHNLSPAQICIKFGIFRIFLAKFQVRVVSLAYLG